MNNKPFAITIASWATTSLVWFASHISIILTVVCGILSIIATLYGIKVSRATLILRRKQINGAAKDEAEADDSGGSPMIAIAGMMILAILFAGCTHATGKRAKVTTQLQEESRVLTTGVVDTLTLQPEANRDAYTSTALNLAKQDQRIEGLPAHPLDVLLLVRSNAQAIASLQARFEKQDGLIQRQQELADKLLQFGQQFEKEHNKSIFRRVLASLGITGTIGAIIALCIFCPAVIPIIGRLFGWCVSKLPALASYIGVVSHKVYDQTIKGIELAKQEYAKKENSEAIDVLHTSLSKSMDGDSKDLVARRKFALGVA